jgi:enamine deaminase RidA (YjgF/YER057c/UK114 family)
MTLAAPRHGCSALERVEWEASGVSKVQRAEGEDPRPRRIRRRGAGAPWEAQVGGCRAIRIGAHVWATGANAIRADGRVFGRGDPEAQAVRCLDVIEETMQRVGAAMDDVVRIRVFLTDIRWFDLVRRACDERFPDHPPASSIIEVSALIHPAMLVEIEAEAFLADVEGGAVVS